MLLSSEAMIDGGVDLGPSGIGALALIWEWLAGRGAEMNLRDEPSAQDGAFVLVAAIGRIRADRASGVGPIDHAGQFPAVIAAEWLADQVRMRPWRSS